MTIVRLALIACLLAGGRALTMRELSGNHPIPWLTGRPQTTDDPLFLTPLIESGQFELAKALARVGKLKGDNVPSYSGYLTVNRTTGSNLFFWFFPALVSKP